MGIVEAIMLIRDGGLVRRSRMPKLGGGVHWLGGKPGTSEIWSIAVNDEGHWPQQPYGLTTADVLATDWRSEWKRSTAWS